MLVLEFEIDIKHRKLKIVKKLPAMPLPADDMSSVSHSYKYQHSSNISSQAHIVMPNCQAVKHIRKEKARSQADVTEQPEQQA